jgi:hypothetical protein
MDIGFEGSGFGGTRLSGLPSSCLLTGKDRTDAMKIAEIKELKENFVENFMMNGSGCQRSS